MKFPRAKALEFPISSAHRVEMDLPVPTWPSKPDAPCPMGALHISSRVPPLLYNAESAVQEF